MLQDFNRLQLKLQNSAATELRCGHIRHEIAWHPGEPAVQTVASDEGVQFALHSQRNSQHENALHES